MGISGRPNRFLTGGITGSPNTSGNDGTITRFGWKAQNKSLEIFSGEAYNVEMGITNELFPNERDETPGCSFTATPEDATNFDESGPEVASDVVRFATFMRFLDQPQPAPPTPSTQNGAKVFQQIGCSLCHTPTFTTGQSSVGALSNIPANLFSDLLLHHMGPDSQTKSRKARPTETNSERLLCGDSDNDSTSFTMDAPAIWSRQFCTTMAKATGAIQTRRQTLSSVTSRGFLGRISRIC